MNEDELAERLENEISPDVSGRTPGSRADDPADEATVSHLRGLLSDEATWLEPDPEGADVLLAAIRAESPPLESPVADISRPPRATFGAARRPGRLVVLSAAAALLLLAGVVGVVLLAGQGGEDGPTEEFAMTGTDLAPSASAAATAEELSSGFAITLDIDGLPPAAPGTYYQGWVKSPDDELVTIGTFHMRGGDSEVELWSGVELERFSTVTVTLQEEGAGAESSGQVVLSGELP